MNFKVSRKEPDSSHPTWHWHFFALQTQPDHGEAWVTLAVCDSCAQCIRLLIGQRARGNPFTKRKGRNNLHLPAPSLLRNENQLARPERKCQPKFFRTPQLGHRQPLRTRTPSKQEKARISFIPYPLSSLRVCTSLFPHASLDQCNSWHVSALQIDYRQCKRKCQIGAPKLPPFRERSVVMVMTPSMYGTFWLHCDASEIWRGFHPFWPWVNMNSGRK